MSTELYTHDVFLSHSNKDKATVRTIAERLRADGLRVWFDDWELKPGDSIPAKIEQGLEQSRVLVLCLSSNAFGSDWAALESGTFRFRDPLNKERRFIPLRLDDAPIKGSLAQFVFIDWVGEESKREYMKLLEACYLLEQPTMSKAKTKQERPAEKIIQLQYKPKATIYSYAFSLDGKRVLTGGSDEAMRLWDMETGRCLCVFKGHAYQVWSVAWSPDQRLALSCGSYDHTVRLWDVETGRCLHVLEGHTVATTHVVWSADQQYALSACGDHSISSDNSIRLWDISTGNCLSVLQGHTDTVNNVIWSNDQTLVLSCSDDRTLHLWDIPEGIKNGRCLLVLEGHTAGVCCLAWSTDQRYVLSGSRDRTLRLWDIEGRRCLRIFEGHTSDVNSVACSNDQLYVLSGSSDQTVRLWNVETGLCLCVLEGHLVGIRSVAWSADQRHAYSGDRNGEIRVWDLSEFVTNKKNPTVITANFDVLLENVFADVYKQFQYTNAKVLLVGDSGVGKTGLSNYLALNIKDEERNASTDGAWATQWTLPHIVNQDGVEREIWLWDFAGQVDYRLVHQLYMDDTAAAVLVFNPQNENPFEGLGQWDNDLQKASRKPYAKLLAAGRIDRGGLVVSNANVDKFMAERGFRPHLHLTSAKTGEGCDELREAIVEAIDWQSIPETTSPALYHRLKQEILYLRDSGLVLIRLAELKQRMELTLLGERFELAELQTVVGLLAGPGMIERLDFGGFILLRPEVLSRYAAAVVRKVRKQSQELGCIREDELLAGALDYQDFERLPPDDEIVVLRTLHETFISRAWCLRQPCDGTALLTFPSYFRRERPEQPSHPNVLVTYRFRGHVEDIYATLVVRLHHTEVFETDQLWKFAADFKTQTGQSLGLKLSRETEGMARLDVYFNPDVDENSRLVFLRYAHNHLTEHALDVVRLRHYVCGYRKCDSYNQPFTDQERIDKALASGKEKIFCPDCGKPILLRDTMEQKFDSADVKEAARKLQEESQFVIDNESRELILVGHAFSISAEAGQIYRGYTNSDHGIDGEIEFKDDQGRATGKRLYMQLKSGDSYLTKRQRDDAEVFQIKNSRWADYWQKQAYPVLLVIRSSDGEIRWMDVSEYLKRKSDNGKKPVRQVVFSGERFDVMSVRRWRERALK